jgi:starch phosphorylase
MAHLAFVGSHTVNGVSALHSNLMKETVFAPLHAIFPDRITNVTNGITPRRWLLSANPGLTSCCRGLRRRAHRRHRADPQARGHAGDAALHERLVAIRRQNKLKLAQMIRMRPACRRSLGAVRRPDQAHPRIQAPAAQHPGDDRAL